MELIQILIGFNLFIFILCMIDLINKHKELELKDIPHYKPPKILYISAFLIALGFLFLVIPWSNIWSSISWIFHCFWFWLFIPTPLAWGVFLINYIVGKHYLINSHNRSLLNEYKDMLIQASFLGLVPILNYLVLITSIGVFFVLLTDEGREALL